MRGRAGDDDVLVCDGSDGAAIGNRTNVVAHGEGEDLPGVGVEEHGAVGAALADNGEELDLEGFGSRGLRGSTLGLRGRRRRWRRWGGDPEGCAEGIGIE